MSKHKHYRATTNATLSIETYGTEKGSERELLKRIKEIKKLCKQIGIDLWIDEVLVEE